MPPRRKRQRPAADEHQHNGVYIMESERIGMTWREDLRCELTPEELAAKADECALALGGIDQLNAERKEAIEETRGELKRVGAEVAKLARELREKACYREVNVHEERRFAENTIAIVREDTGALVRSRPMTPEERQVALFPSLVKDEPGQEEIVEREWQGGKS